MKSLIRMFLQVIISKIVLIFSKFKLGRFILNEIIINDMGLIKKVSYKECNLE